MGGVRQGSQRWRPERGRRRGKTAAGKIHDGREVAAALELATDNEGMVVEATDARGNSEQAAGQGVGNNGMQRTARGRATVVVAG
jgi:hypothetical protein